MCVGAYAISHGPLLAEENRASLGHWATQVARLKFPAQITATHIISSPQCTSKDECVLYGGLVVGTLGGQVSLVSAAGRPVKTFESPSQGCGGVDQVVAVIYPKAHCRYNLVLLVVYSSLGLWELQVDTATMAALSWAPVLDSSSSAGAPELYLDPDVAYPRNFDPDATQYLKNVLFWSGKNIVDLKMIQTGHHDMSREFMVSGLTHDGDVWLGHGNFACGQQGQFSFKQLSVSHAVTVGLSHLGADVLEKSKRITRFAPDATKMQSINLQNSLSSALDSSFASSTPETASFVYDGLQAELIILDDRGELMRLNNIYSKVKVSQHLRNPFGDKRKKCNLMATLDYSLVYHDNSFYLFNNTGTLAHDEAWYDKSALVFHETEGSLMAYTSPEGLLGEIKKKVLIALSNISWVPVKRCNIDVSSWRENGQKGRQTALVVTLPTNVVLIFKSYSLRAAKSIPQGSMVIKLVMGIVKSVVLVCAGALGLNWSKMLGKKHKLPKSHLFGDGRLSHPLLKAEHPRKHKIEEFKRRDELSGDLMAGHNLRQKMVDSAPTQRESFKDFLDEVKFL